MAGAEQHEGFEFGSHSHKSDRSKRELQSADMLGRAELVSSMELQGATNDNVNPGTVYRCKFCGLDYPTRQSLGGHSNIHRKERAQQQMQAVEAVRRRFRYVPYEGYIWATEDDTAYFPVRPLHPSLEYAFQPEPSYVRPLMLQPGIAPLGMEIVNNVDEEGAQLDLTLRL